MDAPAAKVLRLLRAIDDAACDGVQIDVPLPAEEPDLDLGANWLAVRWNFEFQEDYAWGVEGDGDPMVYPQTLGEVAAGYIKDLVSEGVYVGRGRSQRDWLERIVESLSVGAFDAASRMTEVEIARAFARCRDAPSLSFLSPACTLLVDAEWNDDPTIREAAAALPSGDAFWPAFEEFSRKFIPRLPPNEWKAEPLWPRALRPVRDAEEAISG